MFDFLCYTFWFGVVVFLLGGTQLLYARADGTFPLKLVSSGLSAGPTKVTNTSTVEALRVCGGASIIAMFHTASGAGVVVVVVAAWWAVVA